MHPGPSLSTYRSARPSANILNRSSVFGFLSGALAAGAAVYYYILAEYRVSNEMLTEDIYVCLLSLGLECRFLLSAIWLQLTVVGSARSDTEASGVYRGAGGEGGPASEEKVALASSCIF